MFGTDENGYGWSDPFVGAERLLRDTMMSYWGSFMATGAPADPTGYGPAEWPTYDLTAAQSLNLTTPPSIATRVLAENCAFWDAYY